MYITVTPAYGRDYKSQKEAKAAWEEGKDFLIADISNPYCGSYINNEDARKNAEIRAINIRFNSNRGLAVINFKR